MSVRLFVGNLPYDMTEPDLREFFSPIGPLSSVIIPVDRDTGKRRGFAFVEFSNPAHAEEATRRLNNQVFKGRNITINEARARESRADSGLAAKSAFSMKPAVGGSKHNLNTKPSFGSPDFIPNPLENERAARAERRNRNFGADAKPARKRKQHHGLKGEMGGKKGPIRERTSGQFFGGFEDDAYDDDLDLDDYMRDFKDTDEKDAV